MTKTVTYPELEALQNEFHRKGQFLVSVEADFSKGTWTFQTEARLEVAAGDYFIINAERLRSFWEVARMQASFAEQDAPPDEPPAVTFTNVRFDGHTHLGECMATRDEHGCLTPACSPEKSGARNA
jgi:hypothetical protein